MFVKPQCIIILALMVDFKIFMKGNILAYVVTIPSALPYFLASDFHLVSVFLQPENFFLHFLKCRYASKKIFQLLSESIFISSSLLK